MEYTDYIHHEPGRCMCAPSIFEEAWKYNEKIPQTPNPMNKRFMIRRKQCTFGATYSFAGQKSTGIPYDEWPELAKIVLKDVQEHSGSDLYNVVHTNWYPDGKAGLDPHADNETDMVPHMDIYSYTFISDMNTPRGFQFYTYDDIKHPIGEVLLGYGDMLVMKKGMQQKFKHGIKKSTAKRFENLRRINMTVRAWKNDRLC